MPITEGGTFAPQQNIVSPGVFTRENDLSTLAQGVANIGAAIVAPFADGPAFFPATISEVSSLESMFGVADGVYYGPYTAKEYLQEQGIVTVVRVGGLTGYWQKNPLIVYAQPGTWNRNGDIGAITSDSFISLDDANYTTTFNYQQSSSVWNITGSVALGGNKPAGFMTASLKFSKLTGSAASSSINSFIVSLGTVANSATLNNLLYVSASKGKLFEITTRQLTNRFSTSVTSNGKTVGKTSAYTLAVFDYEKSRISGSLSISGPISSAILNFDTAWGDLGSGSINRAPIAKPSYLNYLTNSYVLNGSDIIYGLVFSKHTANQATSFYTASIGGNSSGLPGSTLSSSVKIQSRYDISRLNLNGDITVQFGDISDTSRLIPTQVDGGDGTTLSGSILYAGQTVQIGSITNVLFNRKNVITTQTGATLTALPYFFLTSSVQGQNVDSATAISTAFDESTTTNYLFSSSYFNEQLTVNNTFFNYDSTGTVNLRSGSFASVRVTGACNSGAELNGAISGAFGKYNGSFSSADNTGRYSLAEVFM
jgi:hypothetical protein